MGIPTGERASNCTPKGPNSDIANRIVHPMPDNLNPPLTPIKKIRSLTGVSGSAVVGIIWSSSPILIIPPIRPASSSPPNTFALILTPIEAISMMGNSPLNSLPRSIFTPSMTPENSAPGMPLIEATLAESVRIKSRGSSLIFRHSIPISLILMGSQDGQPTLAPVADSIPKKTPKPALATKVPSPRKAKLRPSPLSFREATFNSAPTEPKETISSSSAASVLRNTFEANILRKSPNSTSNLSTLNLKASTLPSLKLRTSLIPMGTWPSGAEVSCRSVGSLPGVSLMEAETAIPGKNSALAAAMNISPSKSMACPKVTSKSVKPMVRPVKLRMVPRLTSAV